MDEIRRQLILKVADGDIRNMELIHGLEKFRHRERMYQWLIANKITGKEFFLFCEQYQFKWAFYGKSILNNLNKNIKNRPLVGKDICYG